MQITDVRLKKVNSGSRMKAVASVTFDNEFVVHEIKVIESQKGLFIAMPSKKRLNGEHKDIAHPINPETREKIEKARRNSCSWRFWRSSRIINKKMLTLLSIFFYMNYFYL